MTLFVLEYVTIRGQCSGVNYTSFIQVKNTTDHADVYYRQFPSCTKNAQLILLRFDLCCLMHLEALTI